MRTRMPIHVLVVALTLLPGPRAAAAESQGALGDPCVAVGCVPAVFSSGATAGGFGPGSYRLGQTFTPRFTGVLREVRLGLWSQEANAAIAEIRPTSSGVPTSVILGEALVPGTPYSDTRLHIADFSSQLLLLVNGAQYAVTLRPVADAAVITALAAFPPCRPELGTGDFVTSDDFGQTWSIHLPRDRSIVYEACLDAATPTVTGSWGRLKALYR
jgi:hypothetical protein